MFWSQNINVYQPKLWTLESKKEKSTDYDVSWKSKGGHISKLKPLSTDYLHNINHYGCRTRIKFDKDPLDVDQNNCLAKVANVYIASMI